MRSHETEVDGKESKFQSAQTYTIHKFYKHSFFFNENSPLFYYQKRRKTKSFLIYLIIYAFGEDNWSESKCAVPSDSLHDSWATRGSRASEWETRNDTAGTVVSRVNTTNSERVLALRVWAKPPISCDIPVGE